MRTEWKDAFTQGFMCAVVIAIRLEGCVNTRIKEIFQANYTSLDEMEELGVAPEDLKVLRKEWDELTHGMLINKNYGK